MCEQDGVSMSTAAIVPLCNVDSRCTTNILHQTTTPAPLAGAPRAAASRASEMCLRQCWASELQALPR